MSERNRDTSLFNSTRSHQYGRRHVAQLNDANDGVLRKSAVQRQPASFCVCLSCHLIACLDRGRKEASVSCLNVVIVCLCLSPHYHRVHHLLPSGQPPSPPPLGHPAPSCRPPPANLPQKPLTLVMVTVIAPRLRLDPYHRGAAQALPSSSSSRHYPHYCSHNHHNYTRLLTPAMSGHAGSGALDRSTAMESSQSR